MQLSLHGEAEVTKMVRDGGTPDLELAQTAYPRMLRRSARTGARSKRWTRTPHSIAEVFLHLR